MLASKTWFDYDWPASSAHLVATPQTTVQHDSSYDINFAAGRGNLVQVFRFDLTDPDNTLGKGVEFKYGYDINGSLAFTRDHLWHQTFYSYQDSFSDGNNGRNTFAYPTTVTDADGFQTLTKYNFDFGAATWTQTPSPNAGQTAPTQTMTYDSAARLEQITSGVNGAYVRWVYPGSNDMVQTITTVVAGAGETITSEFWDGAGRVRAVSTDHPGSTGQFIGQLFFYDNMGRAVQQSKPTEINAGGAPSGDDASWVYTLQAYDWQGRPTLTTLPDGSTREHTYGGCGRAGGEVTTVRDERGRRRKLTKDVLGRLQQVAELNWDQSVYASTSYTYNVRDQLTQINQAGQLRTFAYDGHGRLQSRTTPEQGTTSYTNLPMIGFRQ